MDDPWDESGDDRPLAQPDSGGGPFGAYPLPEATVAGDGSVLAAIAAAILGILLFWRKKKPDEQT
jgi:hypothetical protein